MKHHYHDRWLDEVSFGQNYLVGLGLSNECRKTIASDGSQFVGEAQPRCISSSALFSLGMILELRKGAHHVIRHPIHRYSRLVTPQGT